MSEAYAFLAGYLLGCCQDHNNKRENGWRFTLYKKAGSQKRYIDLWPTKPEAKQWHLSFKAQMYSKTGPKRKEILERVQQHLTRKFKERKISASAQFSGNAMACAESTDAVDVYFDVEGLGVEPSRARLRKKQEADLVSVVTCIQELMRELDKG